MYRERQYSTTNSIHSYYHNFGVDFHPQLFLTPWPVFLPYMDGVDAFYSYSNQSLMALILISMFLVLIVRGCNVINGTNSLGSDWQSNLMILQENDDRIIMRNDLFKLVIEWISESMTDSTISSEMSPVYPWKVNVPKLVTKLGFDLSVGP